MKSCFMLLFCLVVLLQKNIAQPAADSINDEEVLRRVADKIISETIYEFEGVYNKQTYTSSKYGNKVKQWWSTGSVVKHYCNGVKL